MQFEEKQRNEVEAIQYTGKNAREVIEAAGGEFLLLMDGGGLLVHSRAISRHLSPGFWLIYLVEGMPARQVLTNEEMTKRYRPVDGAWCEGCGAAIQAEDMGGGFDCDLCPACLEKCEADNARIAAMKHDYQAFRVRFQLDAGGVGDLVFMAKSREAIDAAVDAGRFGKGPLYNLARLPLDQVHEYTRADYPCHITLDMAIKHELDNGDERGKAQLERLGYLEMMVSPVPVEES